MTDWSNPETFWLNMTNAVLGVVVLVALAAVAWATTKELMAWARARAAAHEHSRDGLHTFMVPGLGTTMADGGEKHPDAAAKDGKAPSPAADDKGNGKLR
jgi:hypothetical protein